LARLNDVKSLKASGKKFGFGSEFLPVRDHGGTRAVEQILSEALQDMKALFPLSESDFDTEFVRSDTSILRLLKRC